MAQLTVSLYGGRAFNFLISWMPRYSGGIIELFICFGISRSMTCRSSGGLENFAYLPVIGMIWIKYFYFSNFILFTFFSMGRMF